MSDVKRAVFRRVHADVTMLVFIYVGWWHACLYAWVVHLLSELRCRVGGRLVLRTAATAFQRPACDLNLGVVCRSTDGRRGLAWRGDPVAEGVVRLSAAELPPPRSRAVRIVVSAVECCTVISPSSSTSPSSRVAWIRW